MSGPLCKHGWSIHFCGPCSADLFFKSQAKGPRDEDMLAMEPENVPEAAARIAQLEAALRAAYEVYAGSEGYIPETCAEGYQRKIIQQMVDCISAALEERT